MEFQVSFIFLLMFIATRKYGAMSTKVLTEDTLLVFCECPFGYYEASRFPVFFQFRPPCGEYELSLPAKGPTTHCGRWKTYGLRCQRCHPSCDGCSGPDDSHCNECRAGFFNASFFHSESRVTASDVSSRKYASTNVESPTTLGALSNGRPKRSDAYENTNVKDNKELVGELIIDDELLPFATDQEPRSTINYVQQYLDDTDSGSGSLHDEGHVTEPMKDAAATMPTKISTPTPWVTADTTTTTQKSNRWWTSESAIYRGQDRSTILTRPVKRNFRVRTTTEPTTSATSGTTTTTAATTTTASSSTTTTYKPKLAPTIIYNANSTVHRFSRNSTRKTTTRQESSGHATSATRRKHQTTQKIDIPSSVTIEPNAETVNEATTGKKTQSPSSTATTNDRNHLTDTVSTLIGFNSESTSWATYPSSEPTELTRYYRCLSECPDGTYPDNAAGLCRNCDSKCRTCIGPTFLNCTSCAANAVRVLPAFLNGGSVQIFTCLSGCPGNHFNSNGTCTECHEHCDGCIGFGENQCMRCKHPQSKNDKHHQQIHSQNVTCEGEALPSASSLELVIPLSFLSFLVMLTTVVCIRWNYKSKGQLLCNLPQVVKAYKNKKKGAGQENSTLPVLPKPTGGRTRKAKNEYTSSPPPLGMVQCSNCQGTSDDGYELPVQPKPGPSGVNKSCFVSSGYSTPSSTNHTLAKSRRNNDPLPPTPIELDAMLRAHSASAPPTRVTTPSTQKKNHVYKNIPPNSKVAETKTDSPSSVSSAAEDKSILLHDTNNEYSNSEGLYANC